MRASLTRRLVTSLLAVFSASCLLVLTLPHAHAAAKTSRKIVVFADGNGPAVKDATLARVGVGKLKHLDIVNASVVEVDDITAAALSKQPGVLRVEDDALAYATVRAVAPPATQNTPWGITRVSAPTIWDSNNDGLADAGANIGTGVKVGVIDTGIQLNHPDLQANIKGGFNAINAKVSYTDDNGHGTHVAGTIAGIANTVGVVGVAPGASLYAVKVLNKGGTGNISDIIEGIQWCMSNGIQVINMSLGSSSDVQSLHDACIAANNAGIVVVCAAGNSGPKDNSVNYPGAYAECVAVSATDSNNVIASWSSRGAQVDLAAPGMNIYSTYMGSTYSTLSGTSMATPHVTGVATLTLASGIIDANGNGRRNDEVIAKLKATATDLGTPGSDSLYGYGLVNAARAVAP
jgi:subtilisin